MVALVFQQLVKLVVIAGKRGLAAAVLPEGEGVLLLRLLAEAVGVHEDAVLAVLGAAGDDEVALFQQAELAHDDFVGLIHRDAVHAAFLGEQPAAADMEILRENAHRVVMLRRDAVERRGHERGLRRGAEFFLRKIRRDILFQLKHLCCLPSYLFCYMIPL